MTCSLNRYSTEVPFSILMRHCHPSTFCKMKIHIDVTAAVIIADNHVLAARRKAGSHLAGFWEFPGGKIEAGETPEACLQRELKEELGITSKIGRFLGESLYDYDVKVVRLMAYKVEQFEGDFQLISHDELRWLQVSELGSVKWAPADIPLLDFCREMLTGS